MRRQSHFGQEVLIYFNVNFNVNVNVINVNFIPKGADAAGLEAMIKKHYGEESGEASGAGGVTELTSYIEHKSCECLNESDSTPFRAFLEGKSKLSSDCDEQLILVYGFNQNIKVRRNNFPSIAIFRTCC